MWDEDFEDLNDHGSKFLMYANYRSDYHQNRTSMKLEKMANKPFTTSSVDS